MQCDRGICQPSFGVSDPITRDDSAKRDESVHSAESLKRDMSDEIRADTREESLANRLLGLGIMKWGSSPFLAFGNISANRTMTSLRSGLWATDL
jgi:hypothetical protein